MSPKKNKQQNLRSLRVIATTPSARLIENPESRFPREQAIAVDMAQEDSMNQLYRKDAEYGDGSSAFMVMKEQFEGGVGNPPKSLKPPTLHDTKCLQFIINLREHRPNLPAEAQETIQAEIQKMEEALLWAQQ